MAKKSGAALAQEEEKQVELYDVLGDYVFSVEEKRQLAQSLANKNIEIQGLGDEKTAVMSQFKAKIDQATAEVNLLATHLSTGKKQKTYRCWLDFDETRKLRIWREEKTDKVIKEEPMQAQDFQLKF
jgi:hypothetical protein